MLQNQTMSNLELPHETRREKIIAATAKLLRHTHNINKVSMVGVLFISEPY